MPGAKTMCGATSINRAPSLIILPHDGSGACTPSHRNDSPASAITVPAMAKVASITNGAIINGKI